MDKRVLLIGVQKSFMINAISVGLQKSDYKVETAMPFPDAIDSIQGKPEIYILYLGDLTADNIPLFKYLDEHIDSERFLLYLIGNNEELTLATSFIAKEKIQETYLRPLDVKVLTDHLDMVVDYSAVDESLRKKVLIIDDDGAMLRMMKTWLSVKYHVYMASSGKIALTFLEQTHVDLVLLDYEMPVANGPQVLEMLKSDSETGDIPVMFLTGHGDKDRVLAVVDLKPADYLLKTIDKATLLSKLSDFFLRQR